MKLSTASTVAILAAAVLISGCSDTDDQHPHAQPESKTKTQDQPQIFQDQINALDKAKGVEGTIQQGADRDRQTIDDQSR